MNTEYPVDCVLFPTAVAYMGGWNGLFFNRDALPGPPKGSSEPPWVWGYRVTQQGSNGYKHEPWYGFVTSRGTACSTVGPIEDNRMVTWVRVESIADAIQKGPDAYGPSR